MGPARAGALAQRPRPQPRLQPAVFAAPVLVLARLSGAPDVFGRRAVFRGQSHGAAGLLLLAPDPGRGLVRVGDTLAVVPLSLGPWTGGARRAGLPAVGRPGALAVGGAGHGPGRGSPLPPAQTPVPQPSAGRPLRRGHAGLPG